MASYEAEVSAGKRFEFGRNWSRFLVLLDEERIRTAEDSLREMLRVEDLVGRSFLDIGSGSGLFSLAARRLGARVRSFDFDTHSVECTEELKRRYFAQDTSWTVEAGSVLDESYMARLGSFDVVYSWGVLHHTGRMWKALENAAIPVAPSGQLFISIYNDQGLRSRLWRGVKRAYASGPAGRAVATVAGGGVIALGALKADLARRRNPLSRYVDYRQRRGMSAWHDLVDWLGGYPFEVATPEEIFEFYYGRGFQLTRLTTDGGGSGTNQFVFSRSAER